MTRGDYNKFRGWTINLSILDFKSLGAFIGWFFGGAINLSILDFKFRVSSFVVCSVPL